MVGGTAIAAEANQGAVIMSSVEPTTVDEAPAFRLADMLSPAAFPHAVARIEVRETTLSWIILTGPFAYKIKKCVQSDLIDAATLSRRRYLCDEELRLNQRLAADLYVEVVRITRDAGGLRVGGDGPIAEYAVKMKQFETSEELSALLERRAVSPQELVDLADRLADFHARAPKAPCEENFPHTAQLHDAVLGNLATFLSHLGAEPLPPELDELIDWTHDRMHDLLVPLHLREQSGMIRECHGDLHAGNVARWGGRLVPFDCLEFDPKLRWIDVMNDVAFLVMDLVAHECNDLAYAFLNAYLERSGDYAGVRLLGFYAVYRALVRAMVDSLRIEQDPANHDKHRHRSHSRVKTAARFARQFAHALIIMHGPSGSGKSWLSHRLAIELGAVRIRSDLERKRLAGIQPSMVEDIGLAQGIYAPEVNLRTYARLREYAENCCQGGVSAIVDAAFLHDADRRLFRDLALQLGIPFIIVSCAADREIQRTRIETRRQLRIDPSDADGAVLDKQLREMESLSEEDRTHVVTVHSDEPDAYGSAVVAIRSRLKGAIPAI
jgi:aminoglycoside phosphotransferase family enzyme/predicted kinase